MKWEEIKKKEEKISNLLEAGDEKAVLEIINKVSDYREGESVVVAVLKYENASKEVVDAALQRFLDSRDNCSPEHGCWVHSLSHFTQKLWKRRMMDWIRKLNEAAFCGANELGDINCSDRLLSDFSDYANWDDDPADVGITPQSIQWNDWKYGKEVKALIEAAPFESEEAFLMWQIQNPDFLSGWSNEAQKEIVDPSKVLTVIQRLTEFGEDRQEIRGTAKSLVTESLDALKAELKDRLKREDSWGIDDLKKEIKKTEEILTQL